MGIIKGLGYYKIYNIYVVIGKYRNTVNTKYHSYILHIISLIDNTYDKVFFSYFPFILLHCSLNISSYTDRNIFKSCLTTTDFPLHTHDNGRCDVKFNKSCVACTLSVKFLSVYCCEELCCELLSTFSNCLPTYKTFL